MYLFLLNSYLWIKSFHIIFIICWMAGLLYLPRLFAYHVEVDPQSGSAKLFQIMERRLYRIIIMPSMILSLASGFFLVMIQDVLSCGWFHLKLTCVVLLIVLQHFLSYWRKQLATGTCTRTNTFFRLVNEVPSLLLVIIVISVIVKPF